MGEEVKEEGSQGGGDNKKVGHLPRASHACCTFLSHKEAGDITSPDSRNLGFHRGWTKVLTGQPTERHRRSVYPLYLQGQPKVEKKMGKKPSYSYGRV